IEEHRVIYRNAFGNLSADYMVTYESGVFEADVVLREPPPNPKELGLNPETTDLQVITRFYSPPVPTIANKRLGSDISRPDKLIDFGEMRFGFGKAFFSEEFERARGP